MNRLKKKKWKIDSEIVSFQMPYKSGFIGPDHFDND